MSIGTGIKSAFQTVKGMAKSGFLKETVAPGLKSAFKQAGGAKGLGRRVLGGAAIGGAATGTISALRGGDFWEGAKSGALGGALAGAGRHGYQMGQTGAGSSLSSSFQNERTRMNRISSKQRRGAAMRPNNPRLQREAASSKRTPMKGAATRSASSGSGEHMRTMKTSSTKRGPAESSYTNPKAASFNSKKSPNVSNQVHTQTRLSGTNQSARSVVRGGRQMFRG